MTSWDDGEVGEFVQAMAGNGVTITITGEDGQRAVYTGCKMWRTSGIWNGFHYLGKPDSLADFPDGAEIIGAVVKDGRLVRWLADEERK